MNEVIHTPKKLTSFQIIILGFLYGVLVLIFNKNLIKELFMKGDFEL